MMYIQKKPMKRISLSLLFICGCAGKSSKRFQEKEFRQLHVAIEAYEKEDFQQAKSILDSIPHSSDLRQYALAFTAFCHARTGEWEGFKSTLEYLTNDSTNPGSNTILYEVGHLYLGHLEYGMDPPHLVGAANNYVKIRNSSPFFAETALSLGWSFTKVQRFNDARLYFQDVLKSRDNPFKMEANYLVGLIDFFDSSYSSSDKYFLRALGCDLPETYLGTQIKRRDSFGVGVLKEKAKFSRAAMRCVAYKDSSSCIYMKSVHPSAEPVAIDNVLGARDRILESMEYAIPLVKNQLGMKDAFETTTKPRVDKPN